MFGQAAASTALPHNPNNDAEVADAANDGISCMEWSPVSNHLIAGSWDNQIRCWEVSASGQATPRAATSHAGPILCASWQHDGAKVYTGSCDKTAKVWDLSTSQATQVAQHTEPIKDIFWLKEMNCCVTSSWDRTVKYWDGKSGSPQGTLQLPERALAMDVRYPLMVIATANRKIVVVNLTNPTTIYSTLDSPLKLQSRCVACFPDQQGFCLGSIEGRVAVQHIEARDSGKNFAFKCHRDGQNIYAVNGITFHPTYGTFATTGSDGTFNFWDKEQRQRLKAFTPRRPPIPCGAFNRDGTIFAYAVSYDWSQGSEHYKPKTNHMLLHPVTDAEIKPKAGAGARAKGGSFGRR